MRNLLATAVAIAPLLAATGAQAEIVISTARTTPIQTSNATGSAADNVRIASGGSIAVTTGAAVTLDSGHTVDIDSGGAITMANAADNVSGVLVNSGSGGVIMGGAINITDSITEYKDEDEDGDLDGPFAAGTNRAGIRVTSPGGFDGDILIERTGAITVEGNNSYGVAIDSALDGDFTNIGSIRIIGDDTYGVRVAGDVTGDVNLLGTITATGENATGVSLEGDVAGAVKVHGSITTTGYRYTTPPNPKPTTGTVNESLLYLEDLDADDLLQGGPALAVAGNVGDGVLLDTGPAYGSGGVEGDDDDDGVKNGDEDDDGDGKKNSEDTDRDGDGLTDTDETTASLTSLGGAPALQIGSATSSVTLGAVGTGDSAYGLINRGTIMASGVYKGVDGVAVQLGVDGGQTVTIEGGVRNEGSITATGFDANATGVSVGAGASTPTFVNTGTLQAGLRSDEADFTATAVQIDAGASMPSFTNSGVISSNVQGNHADAVGVHDLSGTLTSLTNSGRITATRTANASDETDVDGANVAIDLSANTTGATIVQFGVEDAGEDDVDTDGDGVTDAKEPYIVGDILLGTGADTLDIRNGNVVGDVSFGAGADSFKISGGATFAGAITDADGLLDIDLSDGTLIAGQTTATTISNLDVGADGTLIFNLDPAANTTTGFDVTGAANLAEGAAVGVRFNSLLDGPERFTVISAGDLNAGTIDQSLVESNSPYVYVVEAGVDAAANELYIDARRRTASEAGMIAVEASAYDAVYAALDENEALRNLFLTQTGRDGFFDAYEQMLPDHSGGPLMSLASGVDAVTRALTGRNASAAPGETSAWVQEINFYAEKDKTQSYGFESEGFGIAGGVERGTRLGAVGLSVAFTSSDLEDPEAKAEEVLSANLLELGLYWRAQGQYWTTWARAAAGYASFSADRSLVAEGVYLNNTSDWHGWTAAAAGGASYERTFGKFNVRPEIYAEYFRLSEDARTEFGGGEGFDLDIDSREGHMFSAVAAMNVGYAFGRNGWFRPEVRVGWRQNISVDAGETIARFSGGGSDFILDPDSIEGGGPILGFRLNVGNELGMLSITGDAELLEDYVRYSLLLRASFRF